MLEWFFNRDKLSLTEQEKKDFEIYEEYVEVKEGIDVLKNRIAEIEEEMKSASRASHDRLLDEYEERMSVLADYEKTKADMEKTFAKTGVGPGTSRIPTRADLERRTAKLMVGIGKQLGPDTKAAPDPKDLRAATMRIERVANVNVSNSATNALSGIANKKATHYSNKAGAEARKEKEKELRGAGSTTNDGIMARMAEIKKKYV